MYSMIKRLYSMAVKGLRWWPAIRLGRLGSRNADSAEPHRQPATTAGWGARAGVGRVACLGGWWCGVNGAQREAGFDPGAELGPRLRRVREERGLSVRE